MQGGFTSFLGFLLRPFFRWWFAAVTALASALAFVTTPEPGWSISGSVALLLTLGVFSAVFAAASVIVQGWSIWRASFPHIRVTSVQRADSDAGKWQYILSGTIPDAVGTLVDIHRKLGEAELPLALVEITSRTSNGQYQARTLSSSAGHVRDYANGRFTTNDMVVRPHVRASRIRESLNDLAEMEVGE